MAALGSVILGHLEDARFIVVKELKLSEESYQELARRLGEPIPANAERSWNTRVQGVSDEKSTALLGELNGFLSQKRCCYSHPWEAGDVLILGNYRTLHGRTAISEDSQRCLWRGQVNRRPVER